MADSPALDVVAETCQRCRKAPAATLHQCPYKQEINDDFESECNCCDDCRQECCYDI